MLRRAGAVERETEHPAARPSLPRPASGSARCPGDRVPSVGRARRACRSTAPPSGSGGPSSWPMPACSCPGRSRRTSERLQEAGKTAGSPGGIARCAACSRSPTPLGDAAELAARLHGMGLEVAMADRRQRDTAQAIAGQVGIDQRYRRGAAGRRQGRGGCVSSAEGWRIVAMVGDGSTTRPRSFRPTSGSPSGPAPMSPSRPAT